jgi:hypothetical protein
MAGIASVAYLPLSQLHTHGWAAPRWHWEQAARLIPHFLSNLEACCGTFQILPGEPIHTRPVVLHSGV